MSDKAKQPVKPVQIEKLSDVLAQAATRNRFSNFCKDSYASENLHFYEHIEEYEKLGTSAARVKLAKLMVERYVKEGSDDQVNLSSELRETLVKKTKKSSSCTKDLFDEAKTEVYDLMNKNFFNRFLQSQEAARGLAALHGGDVEASARAMSTYFARSSGKKELVDSILQETKSSEKLRKSTLKNILLDEAIPVQEKRSSKRGSKDLRLRKKNLVVLKGSIPQTQQELEDFLESFYGIYAQEKRAEVETVAPHFAGKGEQLLFRLEKKYNVTFIPHDASADEIMCRVLFEQLWHFYSRYDQSKLDRQRLIAIVNWAICHSVGALNEMLKTKYGQDLNISITLCV